MNLMNYKSYSAHIEYSDVDGCFVGHVVGIPDVVGFHAESVTELRAAFEEAVEEYLVIRTNRNHIGSDFDDFLAANGLREEVAAVAIKYAFAQQLVGAMKERGVTRLEMARRMNTSRAAISRLLDAKDTHVALAMLVKASIAVGLPLQVGLGASVVGQPAMRRAPKRSRPKMPSVAEDRAITASAKSDPDARPLTDKQLKAMVPMKALRGRPKSKKR